MEAFYHVSQVFITVSMQGTISMTERSDSEDSDADDDASRGAGPHINFVEDQGGWYP